jgi:hypothetical protein
MHVAIANGIADEPMLKQFFRSIAVEYWHATEGYVKKRRVERGNTRLYCEFEKLYNQWKD